MPFPVHAVVIARHSATSHAQLLRTIEAVAAQTRPPQRLTLVVCGDTGAVHESPLIAEAVDAIIEARPRTGFAAAAALALPDTDDEQGIWLLDHDCVPEPEALETLVGTLERAPLAALAASKLIGEGRPVEIVSLGVSMTRLGRAVELAAGEIDQGQHDGHDDVLGADVRGMLIRPGRGESLRPDPALGVADLGLDLGVRARLAGARSVLAPTARIVTGDTGPAALPRGTVARPFAVRRAQLHRRLVYAPLAVLPLHWLSLLPLALLRSLWHLVGKRPAAIFAEWAAAATVAAQIPAVAAARSHVRRSRRSGWSAIEPLRITRSQLRQRLEDEQGADRRSVSELRFFSGGGAWAVLAALVVGIASFVALLAWPALGGGALLPLRGTVAALWRDAGWGLRGIGVDVIGPADPFAGVIALLGSLWPAAPSYALVLLWLLALPLAVLGGWFAATRITGRAGLRILGGVLWAMTPTFLTALTDGRPAAVLVHLLLPWLFFAASVAHRSWATAGTASLLLAAVLACAPSLAPAAALLWALGLVLALVVRHWRGALRIAWVPIPALVVFAPLVWWQMRHGRLWALLADPGAVWAGPQATPDAAGRLVVALGFPSPGLAGWAHLPLAGWAPLLLVPLALLALGAAVAPRWRVGIALLVVTGAGLGTALLAPGVFVSFTQGEAVALWPGNGLSLAWVGLCGAALVTLDTALPRWQIRSLAAVVTGVAVVALAVPALTALTRGDTVLTNGPVSTLPAYVAADARGDLQRATLLITPLAEDAVSVRTVWGASETLGAQSTIVNTATRPVGADLSGLAIDLISPGSVDAEGELSARGIRYVLITMAEDETAGARELRLSAIGALSQRAGLVRVGETDKGVLWRAEADARAPELPPEQQTKAWRVTAGTLFVLVIALLLALPTRLTRREARARSQIVGDTEERR